MTGLAWTSVGGETLEVEVNVVDGTGKLELTGNLGDVMKESAYAAMSYVRSRAKQLGHRRRIFIRRSDIHIHFPEGAVPEGRAVCRHHDLHGARLGPDRPRRCGGIVAMTGEISIRGRVLPIGGLKEKTMAALRHGIKTVIIPAENEKDLEEIDQTVRQSLNFITVSHVDSVIAAALVSGEVPAETPAVLDAMPAMPPVTPKARRKPGIRQ